MSFKQKKKIDRPTWIKTHRKKYLGFNLRDMPYHAYNVDTSWKAAYLSTFFDIPNPPKIKHGRLSHRGVASLPAVVLQSNIFFLKLATILKVTGNV